MVGNPNLILLETEAPKSTSDAARASRASLLKKRKMSERDAEVSDEMQVATLMQFVDGVADAAGLGVKLRQFVVRPLEAVPGKNAACSGTQQPISL